METLVYKTQYSQFPSQSPAGVGQTDIPFDHLEAYWRLPASSRPVTSDRNQLSRTHSMPAMKSTSLDYSHTIPTSVSSNVDELKGNDTNQISEKHFDSEWDIECDIDPDYPPGSLENDLRAPKGFLKSFQEKGSAEAARLLSTYYILGDVVKQDVLKAAYLLRYAAERGKVSAMRQLHDLLNEYNIKPLNNESMDHWKEKARKRGAYWRQQCEEEEGDSEADGDEIVMETVGEDSLLPCAKAFKKDADFTKDNNRQLVC